VVSHVDGEFEQTAVMICDRLSPKDTSITSRVKARPEERFFALLHKAQEARPDVIMHKRKRKLRILASWTRFQTRPTVCTCICETTTCMPDSYINS
jgi:hypothetical protein